MIASEVYQAAALQLSLERMGFKTKSALCANLLEREEPKEGWERFITKQPELADRILYRNAVRTLCLSKDFVYTA